MGKHAKTSETRQAKHNRLSNSGSEPYPYIISAPVALGGASSCECAKLFFYGVGILMPVHLHEGAHLVWQTQEACHTGFRGSNPPQPPQSPRFVSSSLAAPAGRAPTAGGVLCSYVE